MDLIGKLFAERYEIIAEIGMGGMAKVYKAKDTVLGRFVAIKILRQEFLGDEEFTNRFTAEAQAAAGLSHQNLVAIYDVGQWLGNNYIVMEFVDGITLKEYIKKNAPLRWQEAVGFATQILQGIAHAHKKGIIHRDIKPQNVVITTSGILKVMDFGIARSTTSYTMKIGDSTIGSVHYFSPEQARGRHTDEKSDIYSLGVVLYEMLTGKLPFDNDSPITVAMLHLQKEPESPKNLNIAIPLSVNDIVLKAMRKDTAERYQSAQEMWKDLNSALSKPENNPVQDEPRDTSSDTRVMTPIKPIVRIRDDEFSEKPEEDVPRKLRKEMKKKKKLENNEDKKDKKLNLWLRISLAVVGLCIILVALYAIFPNMFFSQNTVEIPNLVGQNINDVQNNYAGNKDIKITVAKHQYDDAQAKDVILEQTPNFGNSAKTPLNIQVTVSDGVETHILPDFVGKDERTTLAGLQDLGLTPNQTYESSATIAQGMVMKTSPVGGSTVNSGSVVEIIISSGAGDPKDITMPKLIGYTRDKAAEILANNNLVIGKFDYQDSDYDLDVVISQSVAPGAAIKEFDAVDVVYSSGKKPATATPAPVNYTTNLKIDIPQTKDTTVIKVLVDGNQVYSGTKQRTDGSFTLPITSTNNSVSVSIYYDGVLNETKTIPLS